MEPIVPPQLPEEMTFENVQAYKAALRRYDQARIAAGEATPEQIQKENSVLPKFTHAKILNFPELEECP